MGWFAVAGFFVLFLALAGLAYLVFTSYTSDTLTALGALAGAFAVLTSLAFSYGQSLESEAQRRHINREAGHMFFGTAMLFLAAFFKVVMVTTGKPAPWLATAFSIISPVVVGLFLVVGFFAGGMSLFYVLDHLNKTNEELEQRERARAEARARGAPRSWLDRVLDR